MNETSNRAQAWVAAMRPRTLPLTVACVTMGVFLAAATGALRWLPAVLTLVTALLLQVLSNLANDYGDSVHGADRVAERQGPQRAVQSGAISAESMRRAIVMTAMLAMISGLALVWSSFGRNHLPAILFFLSLGGLAVWAAIRYTVGRRPYGYTGLGDLFVLLFFGWVGVIGTYYLQTQSWRADIFLPATSCGLLAVAVLNVNNMRDMLSDRQAGKQSLPVRLGLTGARRYHSLLLVGAVLAGLIYTLLHAVSPWQFLFLLSLPGLARHLSAIWRTPPAQFDPLLRQMALTSLLFVFTFGLGQWLAAAI